MADFPKTCPYPNRERLRNWTKVQLRLVLCRRASARLCAATQRLGQGEHLVEDVGSASRGSKPDDAPAMTGAAAAEGVGVLGGDAWGGCQASAECARIRRRRT